MKKSALLLLSVLLFSCGPEGAEKPEHLLEKKEMVNILYDLTLLQAIKGFTPKTLDDNKVDAKNYIYKKYDIDSITFAKNHAYYASNLEQYEMMQKEVSERIKKEKEKITGKQKEVKPEKIDAVKITEMAVRKRDSVRQGLLDKVSRREKQEQQQP